MQKAQISNHEAAQELEAKLKDVKTWADLYSIGLEYCIDVISDSGGCVEVFYYYINRACNRYQEDATKRDYTFVPIVVDKTDHNEKQSLCYKGCYNAFYKFNVYETEISPNSLNQSFQGSFTNKYTLKPLEITVFIKNVFTEAPGADRQYLVDMYLDVGDLSKAEKVEPPKSIGYPDWLVRDMRRVIALEKELKQLNESLSRKREWDELDSDYKDWVPAGDDYLERRVRACLRETVVAKGCYYT